MWKRHESGECWRCSKCGYLEYNIPEVQKCHYCGHKHKTWEDARWDGKGFSPENLIIKKVHFNKE